MRRLALLLIVALSLVGACAQSPLASSEPEALAATTHEGVFIVPCPYDHSLPDDPIVFPGQPGASHLHDFVGNKTTNANSTLQSLDAGATTCTATGDQSAYWMPALYINGVKTKPSVKVQAYYSAVPAVVGHVVPFPRGMKLVAGNSKATVAQSMKVVFWQCNGSSPNINHPPTGCNTGELSVKFPYCWDGIGLDTASVIYPTASNGTCPAGHATVLPRLRLRFEYPMKITSTDQVTLASLTPSGQASWITAHADFFNAWTTERQAQLTADCLNAGAICGSIKT